VYGGVIARRNVALLIYNGTTVPLPGSYRVMYDVTVSVLVLFGQAATFAGCVCLGMFTKATVECSFTPVVVAVDAPKPPAQPSDTKDGSVSAPSAEPCP